MLVDGDWRPTLEVAQDPDACGLVSSEGVLRVLRHPRVPGKVPVSPARPDRPQALFTRTLRVGHVGDDVRVWQGIVGAEQDGIFGPRTAAQTKAWQKAHGLVADGIVGPRTRAAAMRAMRTPPPRLPDDVVFDERELLDDIPFVPAVNYTPADRTAIRLVVVHSMEHPEKPSAAEGVANWFGGKHGRAPRASAHLCVDNDSAVECVKPKDVAWAAPGANHDGYQVEHAGYQRQTRAEWLDDYSESMLWLSAQAVRRLVVDPFGVPIRHLTDEQLAVGEAGFVDHHAATRVYRRSTHIDVGPGFPWDVYLRMVQEAG